MRLFGIHKEFLTSSWAVRSLRKLTYKLCSFLMKEGQTQPVEQLLVLGSIEPHSKLLQLPEENQLLYKVIKPEHLISSISGRYLYFNRVDSYKDFVGADQSDAEQLPTDRTGNMHPRFLASPEFSAADYYDSCRSRTYACCFSLEHSPHIWREYANGGEIGKVCLIFSFPKLREKLNRSFGSENAVWTFNGKKCRQIFDLNYGLIKYVDWATHRENTRILPNPIVYTFLKDQSFSAEKEMRITLSAVGLGRFTLGGEDLIFPPSLSVRFDFLKAFQEGIIEEIICSTEASSTYLIRQLSRMGITPPKISIKSIE